MTRRLSFVAALLLAGCAAVPHDKPEVAQYRPAALGLEGAPAQIAGDWWTAFHDPQLDTLEQEGLAASPRLEEALARVRAADAQIAGQQAGLRPQVSGTAQVSRARIGDKFMPPPVGGSTSNIGLAYASLGWDLDLFGRQHAAIRQAAASAQASRLDAAEARLALSVAIAQTYVNLAQAEQQIRVANDFVKTRQQALGYVRSRIRNELSSRFDLEQTQTLLAEAQQAQTRAVEQRDVLVHALAALVGRGADFYPQVTPPTLALNAAPTVPAELPADLLGRRPDLLAGIARIDAATQGRAVARKAFLPDVNISALAGLTAVGLGNLFTAGAGTFSVGPALHIPIFEGGRLRAQYRGATADLDAAVASYDDSVLTAVRDASDALTEVRAVDADLAEEARVVGGLRETVRLDQVRVSTGLGSQLDSIDSGFRLLEAEQALVNLQAQALTRRIQLVAALGGGFDPQRPIQTASASDTQP